MKASALEFRLRFWIFLAIYVLGFTVPWDFALHLDGNGPNAHVWGLLAALLAKTGAVSVSAAFNILLVFGILCAFAGAWFRTWGAAYLGYGTVHDRAMVGDGVVAAGPYRYVRNPLYIGTWENTFALALLMPPSGAIFTLLAVTIFQIRLILGEEAFLALSLGQPYLDYCARVPRLLMSLRPHPFAPRMNGAPRGEWLKAFFGEIFQWGAAFSFLVVGWQYNAVLLLKCVLVSLGVSIVMRGLLQPKSVRSSARGLGSA
jgi:protein-S-isoprenylcysteine O-methyltransferase Ste14